MTAEIVINITSGWIGLLLTPLIFNEIDLRYFSLLTRGIVFFYTGVIAFSLVNI
ncbi:MAG: hypothetical protein ACK4FL_02660 [Microgenomates group bacterium]